MNRNSRKNEVKEKWKFSFLPTKGTKKRSNACFRDTHKNFVCKGLSYNPVKCVQRYITLFSPRYIPINYSSNCWCYYWHLFINRLMRLIYYLLMFVEESFILSRICSYLTNLSVPFKMRTWKDQIIVWARTLSNAHTLRISSR